MDWIISIIKQYLDDKKFCGKIEINFQFGGVTNVIVSQSFKEPK